MKLLLDTHIVLWWSSGSDRIPPSWVDAIRDSRNETFISAVSAWEVELKRRIGKLVVPITVRTFAADEGLSMVGISPEEAELAGSLDWDHKDPFDRMLVAQALERGLTLVPADESMRSAPGVRFLD